MYRMSKWIQTIYYIGHDKFFRARLLTMDSEGIGEYVDGLDNEINGIRMEALKMVWYMRGGLSYETALQLSVAERKLISEIISENMETTKKSGLPFF